MIKQAAARANQQLGLLNAAHANAIASAVEQQLQNLDLKQCPLSLYQTASGSALKDEVDPVVNNAR